VSRLRALASAVRERLALAPEADPAGPAGDGASAPTVDEGNSVSWCWAPEQLYPGPAGAATVERRGFRLSNRWRLAFVLGSVLLAYHYSLRTLLSTLGLDSPLAYLGLVPFMALGLALMRGLPRDGEPDIHDRQIDMIVGVPLMVGALAIMMFLPGRMSTMFWYNRVDLLSLPLFVAGAVALAFGVRTLGRVRVAVAFLLLAWPVPYVFLLDKGLTKFTGVTLAALHATVEKLHVATPVSGGDGSLFSLGNGAHAFTVSVASACSGVDGFVGFLLVGLAFLHLSRGKRSRKMLWLTFGLVLIYSLNLARLLLVFWVGSSFGEAVAIDGLHPYIGLVLFAAGVTVMALTAPWFGVELDTRRRSTPPKTRVDNAVKVGNGGGGTAASLVSTPALRITALALAAAALLAGFADHGLSRFRLVADNLGSTSIQSFLAQPVSLSGWQESKVGEYDWATRFFGGDSSWIRYEYYGSKGPVPVIADVVTTSSLSRLDTYNVQACYSFHGYGLRKPIDYNLGGGVKSTLLTFSNSTLPGEWNALFWVWAVNTSEGRRYERIVLLAPVQGNYRPAKKKAPTATTAIYARPQPETPELLKASQNWLAGFARQLVKARANAPTTSTTDQVSAAG
jgi:exosortase/archaeosortase family protein